MKYAKYIFNILNNTLTLLFCALNFCSFKKSGSRNLVREIWFKKSGSANSDFFLVQEKWLTRKTGGFIL